MPYETAYSRRPYSPRWGKPSGRFYTPPRRAESLLRGAEEGGERGGQLARGDGGDGRRGDVAAGGDAG